MELGCMEEEPLDKLGWSLCMVVSERAMYLGCGCD